MTFWTFLFWATIATTTGTEDVPFYGQYTSLLVCEAVAHEVAERLGMPLEAQRELACHRMSADELAGLLGDVPVCRLERSI